MDWILHNVYALSIIITFIGITSVNFYKIGQNFREIKKLELRVEKNEDENKERVHEIYNELKEIRKEINNGFMEIIKRM